MAARKDHLIRARRVTIARVRCNSEITARRTRVSKLASLLILFLTAACGGTGADAPADAGNQPNSPVNVRAENGAPSATPPVQTETPQTASDDARHTQRPDEAVTEGGGSQRPEFEGTAGIIERKAGGAGVAILRAVRTAAHPSFDRVVFEFEEGVLPGYHVEYIDRPVRQCGSGKVVPLAGDGWLRIRLEPARAHTEQGEATITDRERRPNHPNLKELKLVCDFEAQVEWVLGLGSPNRYRVLELRNPARLVVDVRR